MTANPGVYGLVVNNPGPTCEVQICRVVVADNAPRGTLALRGVGDIAALVGQAHAVLDNERGERVRAAFLQHWRPERAEQPAVPVEGDSCELPLALAALGDLHGCRPRGTVVCTGAMQPDGTLTAVCLLKDKILDALEWFEDAPDGLPSPWRLFIPASEDGVEPASLGYADLICEADQIGVMLVPVRTLTEAATLTFGEAFTETPQAIGHSRRELRKRLYQTDYPQTIRAAETMFSLSATLPRAAPLRGILELEALVIAQWATGRLEPSDTIDWRGERFVGRELSRHLEALGGAVERDSGACVAPDLAALVLNLEAAKTLNGPANVHHGLLHVERGLATPDLVDSHLGEHRKLLGTRTQLRMVAGLRARANHCDSEAVFWLDAAVSDGEAALTAAERPEVVEANDRARVRIYLAQALMARGAPDDEERALGLLCAVLGFNAQFQPVASPQQAPGWALRLLYFVLRGRKPGEIAQHWRDVGHALKDSDESRSLGDAMAERHHLDDQRSQVYDGAIASLVAADAAAIGDVALAKQLVPLCGTHTYTLRHLARWWPVLRMGSLRDLPELTALRSALAAGSIVRPRGPARDGFIDTLLRRLQNDDDDSPAAWRQLVLWLAIPGSPLPLTQSTLPSCAVDSASLLRVRVGLSRGTTVKFEDLPAHSIALDGYVQGPQIDADRRRFSFDHHGNCVRHATLSTCEMVLDAIHVGLQPADLTLYINDLDADTVLSVWLLLQPVAADNDRVVAAIRRAGRYDALGPSARKAGLSDGLRLALKPMLSRQPALRSEPLDAWWQVLHLCCQLLDTWWLAGAPETAQVPRGPGEQTAPPDANAVLYRSERWWMVEGSGPEALADVYQRGQHAGIVRWPKPDGTADYVVGKASEFVVGFDVPRLLAALRTAESIANPGQEVATTWGGGSTIGGSPRNADGSGSRLDVDDVVRVVNEVLQRGGPLAPKG